MRAPGYTLVPCGIETVDALCEAHHGYGGAGRVAVYAFAVVEAGRPVAAYAWQPPPPGAALSVCPEEPSAVLALSRMVAVPRSERRLNHVSKPLRRQMRSLIDRSRWPVLVTYSDEGQGHTGHVYRCSGWHPTMREVRQTYTDEGGRRASSYSGGQNRYSELTRGEPTALQRWEHWACERGCVAETMAAGGWVRVAIPGKRWRSGNQAFRWERRDPDQLSLLVSP